MKCWKTTNAFTTTKHQFLRLTRGSLYLTKCLLSQRSKINQDGRSLPYKVIHQLSRESKYKIVERRQLFSKRSFKKFSRSTKASTWFKWESKSIAKRLLLWWDKPKLRKQRSQACCKDHQELCLSPTVSLRKISMNSIHAPWVSAFHNPAMITSHKMRSRNCSLLTTSRYPLITSMYLG